MRSITPLRETAMESSWRLLVSAAQPYQTLSGPALSVHFHFQPSLLPFQQLPFHRGGVPAVYFHALLHSLAEFATTPRAVRGSHVRQQHAPMEHIWRAVGALRAQYYTAYAPTAAPHPTHAAVELIPSAHRAERDVRLALFDRTSRPIAALHLTDARASSSLAHLDGAAPHAYVEWEGGGGFRWIGRRRSLRDGSVAQHVQFADAVVPPWSVDRCVTAFGAALGAEAAAGGEWAIAAQQSLTHGEWDRSGRVELVTAAPRVFAAYHLPPWRHRIGLPLFGDGCRPRCLALRLEMRQSGRAVLAGTYFLVHVPAMRTSG